MQRNGSSTTSFPNAPATLPNGGPRKILSDLLSFLTFEAHGMRLGLELTSCFILFEILAALFVHPQHPAAQTQLVAVWLLACCFFAVVDRLLFVPPLRALDDAVRLAVAQRVESALQAFEELNPSLGRLIHFPRDRFHLQRARFMADAGLFDAARDELRYSSYVRRAERIELELEMLRGAGEFDAALAILSATSEPTPAVLLEKALVRFEQAYSSKGFGVDRAAITEASKLFEQAGEKAPQLKMFTELYREACRLWLGHAEEAFDALLRGLRSLPFAPFAQNNFSRHLGRLYLSRSYYALTHRELELGRSDFRLGSVLLPPSQLKQLRRKIREELGEHSEASSETAHHIDFIDSSSQRPS